MRHVCGVSICVCVCVSCLDLESVMPIWLPANLKGEIHSGLWWCIMDVSGFWVSPPKRIIKQFLLLSANMLHPQHPYTQTYANTHMHSTENINTLFSLSCSDFEWHLICATASAKVPVQQIVWLGLCKRCGQNIHHSVCKCARALVCSFVFMRMHRDEIGFCEMQALTPSSPLSHWLTAERLKAGKPFQTVELNDGRYSDPSAARYNNTIQTSHQQPCHLHL